MAKTLEFVVMGEEKMHCAGCEQRGHCQVNGQSGRTGVLSGTLRSFRGHFISPSGTSEPQNRTKYLQSGRDSIALELT
jgi:hypothetical protein